MRQTQSGLTSTLVQCALVSATLFAVNTSAQAETYAVDTSANTYYAYVRGMPDLDQRRTPTTWDASRNNGRMYCGPTTAANILSYLHHEGVEDVDVPDIDFEPIPTASLSGLELHRARIQNEHKEDLADDLIAELADEMGTGAFNRRDFNDLALVDKVLWGLPMSIDDYIPGTGYTDMEEVLASRLPHDLAVTSRGNKECSKPGQASVSPRDIFEELEKGNLVILNVGYYTEKDECEDEDKCDASNNRVVMTRNAGHYVIPVGIFSNGTTQTLWYNDPAVGLSTPGTTESAGDYQSAFRAEKSSITLKSFWHEDEDEVCFRYRYQLPEARTYIDGMIVIEGP